MYKYILYLLLATFSSQLTAQIITIGSGGDFANLAAAESTISPGDTVIILNQTFTAGAQFLNDVNGTVTQPVVIIAETLHQPIFQGGIEGIHLINCNYLELNGLVFEQQTGNGVNIDDGGDYSTPSTNITLRNCIFRDMGMAGNHDFLKMSGVDDFLIENCSFTTGTSGSGVDFVGCHNGIVQDCTFDNAGVTGIQCKGGTQFITIRRNILKNMTERALNLGGSTGLIYFRPPLPTTIIDAFEAADLDVYANVFIGNKAPIAYVGCVRVKVFNNTFYKPGNWVIRILQENTTTGFLPCSDNEFSNNIVYQETDLTEVNIGPNTTSNSFVFTNNLWFNEASNSWAPSLPVVDPNELIADPEFTNGSSDDFTLMSSSPAIGSGLNSMAPTSDFDQISYSIPPSIGAFEGDPFASISTLESNVSTVSIYPNPSSGIFSVDLGEKHDVSKFTLLDVYGRVIQSKSKLQDQLLVLEIQEPAGVYLLILESETKKEIFRLVKD